MLRTHKAGHTLALFLGGGSFLLRLPLRLEFRWRHVPQRRTDKL